MEKVSLSKIIKDLLIEEPFYGLLLITMNKSFTNIIPTMAVCLNGIDYELLINQKFWDNLKTKWKIGLLKHELQHIVFGHLLNYEHLKNHKIANIAFDMEINQKIENEYLPYKDMLLDDYNKLVKARYNKIKSDYNNKLITKDEYNDKCSELELRGIYIEDYDELRKNRHAGCEFYYKYFMNNCPKLNDGFLESGSESSDQNDNGSSGKNNLEEKLEKNLLDILGNHNIKDKNGKEVKLSDSKKKLIDTQIKHVVKSVADTVRKQRGIIPREFAELIKLLDNPPKPLFNWKAYMRNFIDGAIDTFAKKSRRKKSKRFDDSPGILVKENARVLVGIDSSGSVSNSELKEFLNEIYHIYKTGCQVDIVTCDTKINDIYINAKKQLREGLHISGRGGTIFTPVVDYYNKNIMNYSCLIYMTDGEAPPPTNNPLGKTLWVLSTKSNINNNLPGIVIKLNINEQK